VRSHGITGSLVLTTIAAMAVAVSSSSANAQTAQMNGYFRTGYGISSEKGNMTCFKAPGAAAKYRLGNECEMWGEFLLSTTAAQWEDGSSMQAHVQFYGYQPYKGGHGTGLVKDPMEFGFNQLWIDGQKIPGLSSGTPWIGTRYYKRESIHIQDFFYWNPSGLGGGIENIQIGEALKLSYAMFVVDGPTDNTTLMPRREDLGLRHDIQLRGIPVNPNGELQFGASVVQDISNNSAAKSGWSAVVRHLQSVLGGTNTISLQYGQGPGSGLGNVSSLYDDSDIKRFRAIDDLSFQVNKQFGGEVAVTFQNDNAHADARSQNWLSIGGRVSYAFTDHWKVLLEVGHDRVTPKHGDAIVLTKATVAPVLAAAPSFWARPELRLFYTFAAWNDAARVAGVDSSGLYTNTNKTNASTYGLQGELWW
jgi:maltoporin